ncbi:MAG TPA: hypothetical protein VNS32_29355 [Flavisolibacter sp.]|nr:hypothetical protein [Flavisolibacter sp.]
MLFHQNMKENKVEHINHEIPIDEQLNLHRKGWTLQRICWALMFLFLFLALAGLFGEGPLSKKTVHAGAITLTYERFARYEHAMKLEVSSPGPPIQSISISQDYAKRMNISRISPVAEKEVEEGRYINYNFAGVQTHTVVFYLTATKFGNVHDSIKINGAPVFFNQIIYP